jgi:general secretion pathway protein G
MKISQLKNGDAGLMNRRIKWLVPRGGFSALELAIVMAMVGILSAVTVPLYLGYREKAQTDAAILGIKVITTAVQGYEVENNGYPDSLADVGFARMKDPWGHPYQYTKIAGAGHGVGQFRKDRFTVPINTDFDLYSMGPDGRSAPPLTARNSRDDIIRANDGVFIGKASDY